MRRLLVLILVLCGTPLPAQDFDPDWEALADKIAERLELQPGERVLLLSHPGRFQPLITALRHAVRRDGAIDLGEFEVLERLGSKRDGRAAEDRNPKRK